jgi:hypothetical protein
MEAVCEGGCKTKLSLVKATERKLFAKVDVRLVDIFKHTLIFTSFFFENCNNDEDVHDFNSFLRKKKFPQKIPGKRRQCASALENAEELYWRDDGRLHQVELLQVFGREGRGERLVLHMIETRCYV